MKCRLILSSILFLLVSCVSEEDRFKKGIVPIIGPGDEITIEEDSSPRDITTTGIQNIRTLQTEAEQENFETFIDRVSLEIASHPQNGTLMNCDFSKTTQGIECQYKPNPNFFGVDSFTFRGRNGRLTSTLSTFKINVLGIPDAPVAINKQIQVNEFLSNPPPFYDYSDVLVVLEGIDYDGHGNSLIYEVIRQPDHGGVNCQNIDNSVRCLYRPNANYPSIGQDGKDSFQYQVRKVINGIEYRSETDSNNQEQVGIVHINVRPAPNFKPFFDGSVSLDAFESTTLVMTNRLPVAQDFDIDNTSFHYELVRGPTRGQIHGCFNLENNCFVNGSFEVSCLNDQINSSSCRYIPDPTESRYDISDSFSYRAYDGRDYSDPVNISIAIKPVNDPPVKGANDSVTRTIIDRNTETAQNKVDFTIVFKEPPLGASNPGKSPVVYLPVQATDVDNEQSELTYVFDFNERLSNCRYQPTYAAWACRYRPNFTINNLISQDILRYRVKDELSELPQNIASNKTSITINYNVNIPPTMVDTNVSVNEAVNESHRLFEFTVNQGNDVDGNKLEYIITNVRENGLGSFVRDGNGNVRLINSDGQLRAQFMLDLFQSGAAASFQIQTREIGTEERYVSAGFNDVRVQVGEIPNPPSICPNNEPTCETIINVDEQIQANLAGVIIPATDSDDQNVSPSDRNLRYRIMNNSVVDPEECHLDSNSIVTASSLPGDRNIQYLWNTDSFSQNATDYKDIVCVRADDGDSLSPNYLKIKILVDNVNDLPLVGNQNPISITENEKTKRIGSNVPSDYLAPATDVDSAALIYSIAVGDPKISFSTGNDLTPCFDPVLGGECQVIPSVSFRPTDPNAVVTIEVSDGECIANVDCPRFAVEFDRVDVADPHQFRACQFPGSEASGPYTNRETECYFEYYEDFNATGLPKPSIVQNIRSFIILDDDDFVVSDKTYRIDCPSTSSPFVLSAISSVPANGTASSICGESSFIEFNGNLPNFFVHARPNKFTSNSVFGDGIHFDTTLSRFKITATDNSPNEQGYFFKAVLNGRIELASVNDLPFASNHNGPADLEHTVSGSYNTNVDLMARDNLADFDYSNNSGTSAQINNSGNESNFLLDIVSVLMTRRNGSTVDCQQSSQCNVSCNSNFVCSVNIAHNIDGDLRFRYRYQDLSDRPSDYSNVVTYTLSIDEYNRPPSCPQRRGDISNQSIANHVIYELYYENNAQATPIINVDVQGNAIGFTNNNTLDNSPATELNFNISDSNLNGSCGGVGRYSCQYSAPQSDGANDTINFTITDNRGNSSPQCTLLVKKSQRVETTPMVDTKTQPTGGSVADIIFVVDNSGSMGNDQDRLRDNLVNPGGFIDIFEQNVNSNGLDFRIEATTTDLNDCGSFANGGTISDFSPESVFNFQSKVVPGTGGSGSEKAFQCALKLSQSNGGWFRSNAISVFIIISDEREQSGTAVSTMLNQLRQATNNQGVVVYTINENDSGHRFSDMALISNGANYSLSGNFGSQLASLAVNIVNLNGLFFLSGSNPDASSLEVQTGASNQFQIQSQAGGLWTYRSTSRVVEYVNPPGEGVRLTARYDNLGDAIWCSLGESNCNF